MARVLKNYEFPTATNRSGKRNWDELCSGNIVELVQGVDFAGKPKWFATTCKVQARKRNLRVKVHVNDTKVVVQFYDPNSQQEQQQQAPAKSKK